MNVSAFEHLELLPDMMQLLQNMQERLIKFAPQLTTKKEVAKFLNVSERTINNYISQGFLKENKHFTRKNDKLLVFIEDAILEFRNKRDKGMVNEEVKI